MSDAPIIVTALLAPPEQAWLEGLRRAHFPPERNYLAAHLTLFHHLPPSIEAELRERLAHAVRMPPPPARIVGVMNLGRGTALKVECDPLRSIRTLLAGAFAELLTPQDRAGWRPHVTIQNKVDIEAARALQATFEHRDFPRATTIVALALWFYRNGPWDPIAKIPFRG